MNKKEKTKSIKVSGKTYEKLIGHKKSSGVPITKIIDKAINKLLKQPQN